MKDKNAAWAGRMIESDNVEIPVVVSRQSDYEAVLSLHQEAHKHDVDSEVKEAIARKLRQLDK